MQKMWKPLSLSSYYWILIPPDSIPIIVGMNITAITILISHHQHDQNLECECLSLRSPPPPTLSRSCRINVIIIICVGSNCVLYPLIEGFSARNPSLIMARVIPMWWLGWSEWMMILIRSMMILKRSLLILMTLVMTIIIKAPGQPRSAHCASPC